jgi:hypothetical protein
MSRHSVAQRSMRVRGGGNVPTASSLVLCDGSAGTVGAIGAVTEAFGRAGGSGGRWSAADAAALIDTARAIKPAAARPVMDVLLMLSTTARLQVEWVWATVCPHWGANNAKGPFGLC